MLDPTLRIKMFDRRTFLDILAAGELLPEHISLVISEAQAMDAAYQRLGKSKASPTNDWQCEISIPGGGE